MFFLQLLILSGTLNCVESSMSFGGLTTKGHGGHGAFISRFAQHQAAAGTPLGSHLAALLQLPVVPFQV